MKKALWLFVFLSSSLWSQATPEKPVSAMGWLVGGT